MVKAISFVDNGVAGFDLKKAIVSRDRGYEGLSSPLQKKLGELVQICDQKGLIINIYGELESTLTDCGVPYTTDKKQWISSAMTMLPNLNINQDLKIWKLTRRIHFFMTGENQTEENSVHPPG